MTTMAPPISPAYDLVSATEWINRYSGDRVLWSQERQTYLRWNPETMAWSWWGPTRQRTMTWHEYASLRQRRGASIDFWLYAVIGTIAFAYLATHGASSAAPIVLLVFLAIGSLMSWLHLRHPLIHASIAVLGYASLFRHHER